MGWLQEISGGAEVLGSVDGLTCGVLARHGAGRAIVLTAELPSSSLFAGAAARLGARPGLQLSTSVPGVVGTTTRTPDGQRLVHLLNPTGFDAALDVSGTGVDLRHVDLRGVVLPAGHRIVLETTAEVRVDPGAATIDRTDGTVIVRSTDPGRPVGFILA